MATKSFTVSSVLTLLHEKVLDFNFDVIAFQDSSLPLQYSICVSKDLNYSYGILLSKGLTFSYGILVLKNLEFHYNVLVSRSLSFYYNLLVETDLDYYYSLLISSDLPFTYSYKLARDLPFWFNYRGTKTLPFFFNIFAGKLLRFLYATEMPPAPPPSIGYDSNVPFADRDFVIDVGYLQRVARSQIGRVPFESGDLYGIWMVDRGRHALQSESSISSAIRVRDGHDVPTIGRIVFAYSQSIAVETFWKSTTEINEVSGSFSSTIQRRDYTPGAVLSILRFGESRGLIFKGATIEGFSTPTSTSSSSSLSASIGMRGISGCFFIISGNLNPSLPVYEFAFVSGELLGIKIEKETENAAAFSATVAVREVYSAISRRHFAAGHFSFVFSGGDLAGFSSGKTVAIGRRTVSVAQTIAVREERGQIVVLSSRPLDFLLYPLQVAPGDPYTFTQYQKTERSSSLSTTIRIRDRALSLAFVGRLILALSTIPVQPKDAVASSVSSCMSTREVDERFSVQVGKLFGFIAFAGTAFAVDRDDPAGVLFAEGYLASVSQDLPAIYGIAGGAGLLFTYNVGATTSLEFCYTIHSTPPKDLAFIYSIALPSSLYYEYDLSGVFRLIFSYSILGLKGLQFTYDVKAGKSLPFTYVVNSFVDLACSYDLENTRQQELEFTYTIKAFVALYYTYKIKRQTVDSMISGVTAGKFIQFRFYSVTDTT